MLDILYIDVSNSNNSYFMYYMLNFSGNYLSATECEKVYDFVEKPSRNFIVNKLAELINSVGDRVDDLVILTDIGKLSSVSEYLNDTKEYLYTDRDTPFVIRTVSEYCIQASVSLFELFSLTFGVSNTGTHLSRLDLIDKVLVYYGLSLSHYQHSIFLISHLVKKYGCQFFTVCCLSVDSDGVVHLLYSGSEYFDDNQDNYFKLNLFFSKVKNQLGEVGISLKSVVPIYYSVGAYDFLYRWLEKQGVSPESYFKGQEKVQFILELFSNASKPVVQLILNSSQAQFVQFLSGVHKTDSTLTALELGKILANNSQRLGLQVMASKDDDTSQLIFNNSFSKDFSSDVISDYSVNTGFRYAVILDCEGNRYNGCSELGGLIIAWGRNKLIKLETFYYKDYNLEEGLLELVDNFTHLSGRYLPASGIPTITYGNTDEVMITNQIASASRQVRRKISKSFKFVNCQDYVYNFLDKSKLLLSDRHLNTVADEIGVAIIQPKHSALNDAKTLFNVLSLIYMIEDNFCL